jgi:hypothetical protein
MFSQHEVIHMSKKTKENLQPDNHRPRIQAI